MKFQQFFYNVTCITFQVHNVLHSSCKGPLTLHTCNGIEFSKTFSMLKSDPYCVDLYKLYFHIHYK